MAELEELVSENVRHLRHVHFYLLSSCFVIIFAIYIALQDRRLDNAQGYLEGFIALFGSDLAARSIQEKIDLAVRDTYNVAAPPTESTRPPTQATDQVQATAAYAPFVAWPSRDPTSTIDVPKALASLLNENNGLLQHANFVDLIFDSLVIRLHEKFAIVLSNSDNKQSDQCLGAILPRKPRKLRDLNNFWNSLANLNVLVVRQHLLYGDYHALLRFKPSEGSSLANAVHVVEDVALKQLEAPLSMAFLEGSAGIQPIDLQVCIGNRQEVQTRFPMAEASGVLSDKRAYLYLHGEIELSSLTPGLTDIALEINLLPHRQSVQDFDGRPVVSEEFGGEPGDDPFEKAFPDLAYFLDRFEFRSPEDLVEEIKSDKIRLPQRESDRLNVFGAQIHVQEIAIWGAFFIIGQQLYFLLHLRTLLRFVRQHPVDGLSVPWIGVYSDLVSRLSCLATAVVLPAGLCFYLAYRSVDPSFPDWLRYAEFVAAGSSLCISLWTFFTFLRLWADDRFV